MRKNIFVALFAFFTLSSAYAAGEGLVIHAAEIGVGKFHREDNRLHPYSADNAWTPYILPMNANSSAPLSLENADGSRTIFFHTLEELMRLSSAAAAQSGKQIAVLNINGHGLPGFMWYPADEAARASWGCYEWQNSADADDSQNYNAYYSALSKGDVMYIRNFAESLSNRAPCTTGLADWQSLSRRLPEFKAALAPDAQIHFLSCVVGLGRHGQAFTQGIAALLLGPAGRVSTSLNFGLGDWSMPEGMGFWDYQDDAQLARDNRVYPVNRKDREVMQKGSLRIASYVSGAWTTGVAANQDFLFLDWQEQLPAGIATDPLLTKGGREIKAPAYVRVPGTSHSLPVYQE